ncbi:protein spire homolog 2 isoform X2 [Leptidea sinapis]|uniref:protein spire homolog 2 isoform X2 n=1 Tax=Leptidea sinapis TaxID=189913 RepID=UPI0021C35326|nr:protein spire homolog 2 isoform X2 [Leptidea sinapis]
MLRERACAADSRGCVSLQQVLAAFSAGVTEQHAWALLYQAARCFQREWTACGGGGSALRLPLTADHLLLHRDGDVHADSLRPTLASDESRPRVSSEHELVKALGLLVFEALDFAQDDDEERLMSPELERLIGEMTSTSETDGNEEQDDDSEGEGARTDTDDEGIERDADPTPRAARARRRPPAPRLADIVQRCGRQGGGGRAAEGHYRAVVRALLAEARELASFLERVRDAAAAQDLGAPAATQHQLRRLHFSDWLVLRRCKQQCRQSRIGIRWV